MDDLEDVIEKGDGINFIPCVKWVKRGAAKSQPDKVNNWNEILNICVSVFVIVFTYTVFLITTCKIGKSKR